MTGVVDLSMTFGPGRYWIGFWKEFLVLPSTLHNIEFSEETEWGVLQARDQEGKQVFLDISVQYSLQQSKVTQLYREVQLLYPSWYNSALKDTFSKVLNNFPIAKIWEDHRHAHDTFLQACEAVLAERHATCWDVQILRLALEDRYDDALVRTQVRKQAQSTEEARKIAATVRAKTEVLLAGYRKNATIITSEGDAAVYELKQAAVANAQEAIVTAQAELLEMIKEIVAFNATSTAAPLAMNESQLLLYKRYAMLHKQAHAQLLYGRESGLSGASEALAMRKVIDYWEPGGEDCPSTRTENPDEAMRSYSSVYRDDAVGTGHARSMLDSALSWSAKNNQLGEWMQIDLGSETIVAGVVTQGRHKSTQAVSEYVVQYSTDSIDWSEVNHNFLGSTSDEQLPQEFPNLVSARYIRILPQSWEDHMSMRAGLLVCTGAAVDDGAIADDRRLQEPALASRSRWPEEQEDDASLVEL